MVVGDFPEERDTIVIGAGPGGYVAAIRAAQLGQKVTIIEKEYYGGTCLNVGCIPSKAMITIGHRFLEANHSEHMGIKTSNVELDFKKAQEWKSGVVNKLTTGVRSLLKKNKVEMIEGEAFFVDNHSLRVVRSDSAQTYKFNNVIIATGSRPLEIPGFKYSKRVLSSTGALALKEVPKEMVVIGGGYIGTELSGAFANLGTKITILEGGAEILPTFEKDMIALVKRNFKNKKVDIVTKALAKSAEETEDGVKITYEANGKEETIQADYVLVTVGRRPNTDEIGLEQLGVEMADRGLIKVDKQCRTNVPNVFAIGDVVPGAQLAHKASYEAKVAAEAIALEKSEVDYQALPAVVFSDPELATVGMTEKEAKEKGFEVKAAKFPLGGNGRALSLDAAEGFVRLVTRKEDGIILGAQIAGVGASDLISEIAVAIESSITAEDIALTIHPHPTLGETVMESAEVALGHPIHV